jgi:hypothetical protein
MTPFLIGLCVGCVVLGLIWRHVRLKRAANRPEVIAAAAWWTRTITGMARAYGRQLDQSTRRSFDRLMRKQLGKMFLKEGFYPMVSSHGGRLSREFYIACDAAGLSYNWIPPEVVMLVYPDCVTVRCGTDKEDQLQIVWSPGLTQAKLA